MVMYKNTHPNSIHIVVDGTLKQINSGEEFYSKTPLNYDFVNKVPSKPKNVEKPPIRKKRVNNGNSKPTS
tara:strand:- start:9102 stop:9311 length:210 start_codon:yes stop_codon:yes gene_type:complete